MLADKIAALGLRTMQWALCFLLPLWPGGAEGRSARRVAVADDTVVRLATQLRHTTLLALPADERILEFVLGDPERWGLAGAANIALLKPMAAGVRTSVTLVTDAGRIYAFAAEEGSGDPDLLVHVRRALPRPARAALPAVAARPVPVPVAAAKFPPAPVLAPGPVPARGPLPAPIAVGALPPRPRFALRAVIVAAPSPVPVSVFPSPPVLAPTPRPSPPLPFRAAVPVLLPPAQAASPVPARDPEADPVPVTAQAVELPAAAVGSRGTMRFEYALDAAARGEPFRVIAMWNDGERTWFRSPAAGLWDVYAAGDVFSGERVECKPVEEGLCAVPRVLGDGALRMGDLEARWRLLSVQDPR